MQHKHLPFAERKYHAICVKFILYLLFFSYYKLRQQKKINTKVPGCNIYEDNL